MKQDLRLNSQFRVNNPNMIPPTTPPSLKIFDWKEKWLKGEEYSYILYNIDLYEKQLSYKRYPSKTHPLQTYLAPENGTIYFMEGNSVGSGFGFPRVQIKKRFRWYPKKMNFTTDLPKKNPLVTYIVASAVKCQKFFPNNKDVGPSFRMHAVILSKQNKRRSQFKDYILCHIRKIDANYKSSKSQSKRKAKMRKKSKEDGVIVKKFRTSFNSPNVNMLACQKKEDQWVSEGHYTNCFDTINKQNKLEFSTASVNVVEGMLLNQIINNKYSSFFKQHYTSQQVTPTKLNIRQIQYQPKVANNHILMNNNKKNQGAFNNRTNTNGTQKQDYQKLFSQIISSITKHQ